MQPARLHEASEFRHYPVMNQTDCARLDSWLRATKVQPIRAGVYTCTPAWRQERRRLHNTYWYWIEAGSGTCFRDGAEPLPVRAPGLLLLPRDCFHAIDGDGELTVHTVHFLADVYGSIDLAGLLGLGGWYEAEGTQLGDWSMQAARDFTLQAPGWRQSMAQAIWAVLLYLARERWRPGEAANLAQQQALAELRPALDYLEAHLPEPWLSVTDLAGVMGVGETTLRQRFGDVLGLSPVTYLRRRRIDRACQLLSSTAQHVQDIATRCGFSDAPYFCRTFKALTGQTPLAYRGLAEDV